MERTVRNVMTFGFTENKAREALANVENPSDVEAAVSWLLDHGEEDTGGQVDFKHCPHVDDLGHEALVSRCKLVYGQPCVHGCSSQENWLCLLCGETRCGRYSKKHSVEHWQTTKREQERTLTVEDAARGRGALGHPLALGLADLSLWCYECQSYVQHEQLQPLVRHMEGLKFGTAQGAPADVGRGAGPAAVPLPGEHLQAAPVAMHGRRGAATWEAPRVARVCAQEARPGYRTKKAHEYLDVEDVLREKVRLLSELIRESKHCVAYTGAGISTASGIDDYATRAPDSVAKAGAEKVSPWRAQPTLAHHVLVALHRAGHLKHWVQQNHDGLPQKAGYPQQEINEIHGAWYDPSNPVVPMDGSLRADLIQWMLEWEDKADLCLALGTSMVGMNADRMAVIPAQRHKAGHGQGTVIVALQQTQYDDQASLRIFAPIDRVMQLLAEEMHLGVSPASLCSRAAAGPGGGEPHVFRDLPYGPDGNHDARARMTLDLREGSRVRIANQPTWDKDRWGGTAVVVQTQDSLKEEGHYALRVGNGGGGVRILGRWWLEAALAGAVPSIPVVPCSEASAEQVGTGKGHARKWFFWS